MRTNHGDPVTRDPVPSVEGGVHVSIYDKRLGITSGANTGVEDWHSYFT